MQNYSDLVLFNGQPLAGASVSVLNYPSGSLATIYVDNGITVGPNPITTSSLGRYNFYAANGRYSLQISYPNTTTQTILDFPLEDDPANPQVANITSGTISGVAISASTITSTPISNSALTNVTATTNSRLENTGLVATDAFVNQQISSSIATIPATTTGGTYNQASLGSGLIVTVATSGGVITGINSVPAGGTNYAVGDVLVLASGNQDAIIRITAVSGGVVSMGGVSIVYGGTGYTNGQQASAIPVPPGQRSLVFSGTLTSNLLLIIQGGTYLNASRRIEIVNNTTGAFTTTVKLTNGSGGSTGNGVVIPQGTNNSTAITLFTDGVNDVWPATGLATIPGRFLNVQIFTTAGTSSYTPTAGTNKVVVEVIGGGGGGGGVAAAGATTCGAAAGGGGGGYARSLLTSGFSGSTITIAAASAGGAAGANAGTAGGTCSFGAISATGGGAGGGSAAGTPPSVQSGSAAAGIGSGGNLLNQAGIPGAYAFILSTTSTLAGGGGSSVLGGGAAATVSLGTSQSNAGTAGRSFGAGGSGGSNTATAGAAAAGGSGAVGAVIVWEYS